MTIISRTKFLCLYPRRLHIKFQQYWPSGFREDLRNCGRRRTDGPRTEVGSWPSYKLTLCAFGGELKTEDQWSCKRLPEICYIYQLTCFNIMVYSPSIGADEALWPFFFLQNNQYSIFLPISCKFFPFK